MTIEPRKIMVVAAALLVCAAWSSPAHADDGEARAVALVLAENCARCHGAALRRPKGRFGFVTDLGRLARTPRYVTPGIPGKSLLYTQIAAGDMPPKDDQAHQMDPASLERLRAWIAGGAKVPAALVVQPPSGSAASPPPTSGRPSLARRLGQFHPLLVHFPVALLLSALLAEVLLLVTKRASFAATARFCLLLGAAGALVALGSGWFWSEAAGMEAPRHRWLALATTAFAMATCVLERHAAAAPTGRARWLYRVALLATVALLALTGQAGGELTYGPDHHVPLT